MSGVGDVALATVERPDPSTREVLEIDCRQDVVAEHVLIEPTGVIAGVVARGRVRL